MGKSAEQLQEARERVRAIAADHAERGDQLGWFDAVYSAAGGNIENIPWADLEPNRFFKRWAEDERLTGDGRKALVVGCGLGDDARYLYDLGFDVTAFDLSATAIEWAKKLHKDTKIHFETADLFQPFREWIGTFKFVLEVYTIQPLPMEMRERAIDSVASFVEPGGELVVVCRGRDDDEEVGEIPYPLSKKDLRRFEQNGLRERSFVEMPGDEEEDVRRFVVHYNRPDI